MRDSATSVRIVPQPKLLESPVAVLRRRQGLSPDDAAKMLGISVLRLARLEAATRRLPGRTLRGVVGALTQPPRFTQPSFFDHVDGVAHHG
ncbi:MAG TPA: helix-turn-helix transcriptional regulator [Candidatus Elarobacter sp.]|nr:helix-turn-helix transcriptional regulator [Candidatus Elarobacter sp.]